MVDFKVVAIVAKVKAKADQSVDFTPKNGAVCPVCGTREMPVVTSRPWVDNCKVRFHRCQNKPDCLLAVMETSIKSVQIDLGIE